MISRRLFSILAISISLALAACAPVFAQSDNGNTPSVTPERSQPKATNVGHAELQRFATAWKQARKLEQQLTNDVRNTVSGSDLSLKRFSQITNAKNNGGKVTPEVTSKERTEYKKLSDRIQTMQHDAQQKMLSAVRGQNLTIPRFNQIARAVRSNSDLYKQFQQILQQSQEPSTP